MASAKTRLHRTTVDIDLDAFERAREALGTSGYRDTIDAALREAARREALRRGAEKIRRGEMRVPTPDQLAEMRRPRFP